MKFPAGLVLAIGLARALEQGTSCDTLRDVDERCEAWAANASFVTGDMSHACSTDWGRKNCAHLCCGAEKTLVHILRRASDDSKEKCSELGAGKFQNCFDSQCCADPGFGCFKKVNKNFAMCRPLNGKSKDCVSTEEWTCPGRWQKASAQVSPAQALKESCAGGGAGKFKACTTDKCCQDNGFGCFKKPDIEFALCRPLGGDIHACESTSEWICPLEWKTRQEKEQEAKPFGVKEQNVHARCPLGPFPGFPKFAGCWDGTDNCCDTPNYGCFKKVDKAYAQCRPLGGHYVDCKSNDEWLCPQDWVKPSERDSVSTDDEEDYSDEGDESDESDESVELSHARSKSSQVHSKSRNSASDDEVAGAVFTVFSKWFWLFLALLLLVVAYIAYDMRRDSLRKLRHTPAGASRRKSTPIRVVRS